MASEMDTPATSPDDTNERSRCRSRGHSRGRSNTHGRGRSRGHSSISSPQDKESFDGRRWEDENPARGTNGTGCASEPNARHDRGVNRQTDRKRNNGNRGAKPRGSHRGRGGRGASKTAKSPGDGCTHISDGAATNSTLPTPLYMKAMEMDHRKTCLVRLNCSSYSSGCYEHIDLRLQLQRAIGLILAHTGNFRYVTNAWYTSSDINSDRNGHEDDTANENEIRNRDLSQQEPINQQTIRLENGSDLHMASKSQMPIEEQDQPLSQITTQTKPFNIDSSTLDANATKPVSIATSTQHASSNSTSHLTPKEHATSLEDPISVLTWTVLGKIEIWAHFAKKYTEMCGRRKVNSMDMAQSLVDTGTPLKSLCDHINSQEGNFDEVLSLNGNRPVHELEDDTTAMFDIQGPPPAVPSLGDNSTLSRKCRPEYIAEHLPTFPEPHTFVRTPVYEPIHTSYIQWRRDRRRQAFEAECAAIRLYHRQSKLNQFQLVFKESYASPKCIFAHVPKVPKRTHKPLLISMDLNPDLDEKETVQDDDHTQNLQLENDVQVAAANEARIRVWVELDE